MKYHYLQRRFTHRVTREQCPAPAPPAPGLPGCGSATHGRSLRFRRGRAGRAHPCGGLCLCPSPRPPKCTRFERQADPLRETGEGQPSPRPQAATLSPRPPLTALAPGGRESCGEADCGNRAIEERVSAKTSCGEFGWGGTPVKRQRRCPEALLSVNRNHAWEEKAKSAVDAAIASANPKRASVA